MEKEVWIKEVRNYLDESIMCHLHSASLKTENVDDLKELLKRAKYLMGSYVEDAETYLKLI